MYQVGSSAWSLGAIPNITEDIDVENLIVSPQKAKLTSIYLLITVFGAGCLIERRLPQSVLDELRDAAVEMNEQTKGWSGSHLEIVSDVDVIQALSPTQRVLNERLPHIDEFWCVTLELKGIRDGKQFSYENEWFAILNEGSSEWNLIPRYIVAYHYEYELLCADAVP